MITLFIVILYILSYNSMQSSRLIIILRLVKHCSKNISSTEDHTEQIAEYSCLRSFFGRPEVLQFQGLSHAAIESPAFLIHTMIIPIIPIVLAKLLQLVPCR